MNLNKKVSELEGRISVLETKLRLSIDKLYKIETLLEDKGFLKRVKQWLG